MKYKLIHSMCQMWENRWIHILMLSFLTLGACSNESVLPPTSDPIEPADTAYLSLSIDFKSDMISKAYIGEAFGTSEENYVQMVRLVLYDGELPTSKVVKAFNYAIETNNSGSGSVWIDNSTDQRDLATTSSQTIDKSHFVTYARKVPMQDYKMLVIVNPTDYLLDNTRENDAYSLVEAARKIEGGTAKTGNVGGLAEANYFLMTSGPGLIDVPASALSVNVRSAHNSPVPATVGRVVAKVTVATPANNQPIKVKNGAQVGNIQWELDITNRYTFWIKKFNSTNRASEYGEDPNYTGYGGLHYTERENYFFYQAAYYGTMPAFSYAINEPEYCLENTMDATDQKQNYVITRAVIRCTYKPANVDTFGEGFYEHNGFTYSFKEMSGFVEKAETTPAGSSHSALCDAILAAEGLGYTFVNGRPYYKGALCSESFSGVSGISYYHQGINYYAVKVLHAGEVDDTVLRVNHYGVVRNTHYTIHINEILGPGSPYIFGYHIGKSDSPEEDEMDHLLFRNIKTDTTIR